MDYQANSKRTRDQKDTPAKVVEKVIVGEVVVKKKSVGRKIKDLFVEADFRSVAHYIVYDVMIPAAKNMMVDSVESGIRRVMYGEMAGRRRMFGSGPTRITYNNPINRSGTSYYEPHGRNAPPIPIGPRNGRPMPYYGQSDVVLSTREDAEKVLEALCDIIDNYESASIGDLNELIGVQSEHVDQKRGWTYLANTPIRQVREGYLIEFPPAELI